MAEVWGVLSPREFQVQAIAWLVFQPKTCLFLLQKTGEGKSAVVLTSAMLLHGISLVVVPLLSLGCDQVAKAQRPLFKVESYHLDKNCGEDHLAVQWHLLSITDRRSQPIIIFASPQSLKVG
jgi:superfamily II DNA helicase RecQ